MSQSERERALRAAADIAKTQRSGWRLNTSGNMASDLIEKNILALIDQPAALDTPQEPTPAAPPASELLEGTTPGPWHVHRGGNFVKVVPEGWEEMVKKNGYYGGAICDMDDWSEREGQHNHEMVSVGANAELIVAAVNALAAAPRPALSPQPGGEK